MTDSTMPLILKVAAETGVYAVVASSRDTKILCLQRFVRLFAYGASFLILAHFLSGLGFSEEKTGIFMTLTLLGDVVISFVLTTVTDKVGRRLVLAVGASAMAMSGLVFYLSSNYWILLLASVLGVISPSGNEIGPFRAVEESVLAHLNAKEKHSDIFAWYTLFGTAGAALGTLSCGWMVQLLGAREGWTLHDAQRTVFLFYAALGAVKLVLNSFLSSSVELDAGYHELANESDEEEGEGRIGAQTSVSQLSLPQRVRHLIPHISAASRAILLRLIFLFAMDSFASGIASPSWLTYFFTTVHSLKPSTLGTLFLVSNILGSVSNLVALPVARRIGPLKTMVFGHLPSTVFLALIPLPPADTQLGTGLSMTFLALRACTQSVDQAPRQAFLAAAVLPGERTAVLGVVNIVKTLSQAGGLGTMGVLAGQKMWVVSLAGAGLMKAAYDLLLLWMFLGVQERERGA
ncbi:major facilitator superfamily transporter [Rhypophila decipiens]|uniref:Major facilitator superfamily transporter n=1 Tax=Rhypophila decipiens TaxID=261697 RepID=A0AAN6Y460_9PEZI|nr:major facilitator superfamily transporter [Rhypophila decipiens]